MATSMMSKWTDRTQFCHRVFARDNVAVSDREKREKELHRAFIERKLRVFNDGLIFRCGYKQRINNESVINGSQIGYRWWGTSARGRSSGDSMFSPTSRRPYVMHREWVVWLRAWEKEIPRWKFMGTRYGSPPYRFVRHAARSLNERKWEKSVRPVVVVE